MLQVQELKEKGNECVRNKKYAESVFHYTHAIKLDPLNYSLYSNRSLAFLKMQQFYFAMEDAKETIRLKPDWAKVEVSCLVGCKVPEFSCGCIWTGISLMMVLIVYRVTFERLKWNFLLSIFQMH